MCPGTAGGLGFVRFMQPTIGKEGVGHKAHPPPAPSNKAQGRRKQPQGRGGGSKGMPRVPPSRTISGDCSWPCVGGLSQQQHGRSSVSSCGFTAAATVAACRNGTGGGGGGTVRCAMSARDNNAVEAGENASPALQQLQAWRTELISAPGGSWGRQQPRCHGRPFLKRMCRSQLSARLPG